MAEDEETKLRSAGGRVESNQRRNQGEVVRPSQARRVELQAAQRQQLHQAARQQLINTKVMKFQIMVSREKGGRHRSKTRVNWIRVNVRLQGLKRQPEFTTEDLEDGDQGDADADMKTLGAVCEEPVITMVIDSEEANASGTDEESYVDDVNGGFLDPELVREARVEEVAGYLAMHVCCRVPVGECVSHKVNKTRWVDANKGDERAPEIRCRLAAKEMKKRN